MTIISIYGLSKIILLLSIILAFISILIYFLSRKGFRLNLVLGKKLGKEYSNKKKRNYVGKDDIIYNALLLYPQLEDFLYYEGAKSIKNPIVKTTFTKKTTFSSLARSLKKDEDEFIEKVNSFIRKILED